MFTNGVRTSTSLKAYTQSAASGTTAAFAAAIDMDNGYIFCQAFTNQGGIAKLKFVLEYTKTTDTPVA